MLSLAVEAPPAVGRAAQIQAELRSALLELRACVGRGLIAGAGGDPLEMAARADDTSMAAARVAGLARMLAAEFS